MTDPQAAHHRANSGPHDLAKLHELGYRTAASTGLQLGLPGLTCAFVMVTLDIPPDQCLGAARGLFWSPASQDRIRLAIINMLRRPGDPGHVHGCDFQREDGD